MYIHTYTYTYTYTCTCTYTCTYTYTCKSTTCDFALRKASLSSSRLRF